MVLQLILLIVLALEIDTIEKNENLSLWSLFVSYQNDKTYYLWESQESAFGLPKGRLKLDSDQEISQRFPKIQLKRDLEEVGVYRLSDLSKGKKFSKEQYLFIYDDWSNTSVLGDPLYQLEKFSNKMVCLIDQSATMAETNKNGSGLSSSSLALKHLLSKRKKTKGVWEVYTFSDQLTYRGSWGDDAFKLFSAFETQKGETVLLKALQSLDLTLKESAHLTVITDGIITERDEIAIIEALRNFRNKGHEIAILSPELKRLEHLKRIYDHTGVLDKWMTKRDSDLVHRSNIKGEKDLKWNNIPATVGTKKHTPILFEEGGLPIVYLSLTGLQKAFHIVGEPEISMMSLKKILLKSEGKSPVLKLSAKGILIDIFQQKGSLFLYDNEWNELESQSPGVYFLPWNKVRGGKQLLFSNPDFGIFELTNLDFIRKQISSYKVYIEEEMSFSVLKREMRLIDWGIITFLVVINALLIFVMLEKKPKILK